MSLVVNHQQWGVFVGHSMGMAFWSKLDPAGQESAPVFNSAEEVAALMGPLWLKIKDQVALVYVTPDIHLDRVSWASMKACVAAGLDMWTTDTTPRDTPAGQADAAGADGLDANEEDEAAAYQASRDQGLRARMH